MSSKESNNFTSTHPPDHEISNSENSDQESDAATTGSSMRIITPPTTVDDNSDTYTSSRDGDSDSAEGSHSFSDRRPEDCWGDLDYDCRLCGTDRVFCPGCTGGMISKVGHGDLFMGCLVDIRCPLCVGEAEAYQDKDFWQRNYGNCDSEEAKEYTKIQMDDIEKKYPGWSNRETRRRESSGEDE